MPALLLRLLLVVSASLLAVACSREQAPAPAVPAVASATPEAAIRRSADLLKQGDVRGFLQNSLPPAEFERMQREWTAQAQAEPVTDEERERFADTMARLTAPGAEQALFAEIEPQLQDFDRQYRQQIPLYVNMGSAWLEGIVRESEELTEAEKTQALAAIQALAGWVQETRFTDPDSVRQVIDIAVGTARRLDLETLDQARAMDFDQTMEKAALVLDAFKRALDVYGLSVDGMLDSITPHTESIDGDTATVRVDYQVLGTELSTETEMVRLDGRWYGKESLERLQRAREEDPAGATPAEAGDAGEAAEQGQ